MPECPFCFGPIFNGRRIKRDPETGWRHAASQRDYSAIYACRPCAKYLLGVSDEVPPRLAARDREL